MHEAMPPLTHTSSWRGAFLSTGTSSPFTLSYLLETQTELFDVFLKKLNMERVNI
jgi:hypothetical protein